MRAAWLANVWHSSELEVPGQWDRHCCGSRLNCCDVRNVDGDDDDDDNNNYVIVPITVAAIGVVTEDSKKNLEAIPGTHSDSCAGDSIVLQCERRVIAVGSAEVPGKKCL